MIRLHGKPISDDDAGEVARWLRVTATAETGLADRIDRAIDAGGGLIATNRTEAQAVLRAIGALSAEDPGCADRLEELTDDLQESFPVRFGH